MQERLGADNIKIGSGEVSTAVKIHLCQLGKSLLRQDPPQQNKTHVEGSIHVHMCNERIGSLLGT